MRNWTHRPGRAQPWWGRFCAAASAGPPGAVHGGIRRRTEGKAEVPHGSLSAQRRLPTAGQAWRRSNGRPPVCHSGAQSVRSGQGRAHTFRHRAAPVTRQGPSGQSAEPVHARGAGHAAGRGHSTHRSGVRVHPPQGSQPGGEAGGSGGREVCGHGPASRPGTGGGGVQGVRAQPDPLGASERAAVGGSALRFTDAVWPAVDTQKFEDGPWGTGG